MKTTMILVSISAALAIVLVCVLQSHKLARERRNAAALQVELQKKAEEVESLQARQSRLEQQRRDLLAQTENLTAQVQTQAEAISTNSAAVVPAVGTNALSAQGEKDKGGMGKMLSKMLQDPDTKKFIRDQQRTMMDQLYAPLVKQLGLTPEQASQFKDLLADNNMKGAEKASSLFGSPQERAEALKAMEADQKASEEQIKTFLGEDGYKAYQAYQETAGERMMLNTYKQQHPSDYPITDAQTEQLLTIMHQEKKAAADSGQLFPSGSSGMTDAAKLEAMLSEGQSEKLFQAQETMNQRVFERARMILSPDQLQAFGGFQTNQLQMMRMSFGMAKKLLSSDNPSADRANRE